MPRKIDTLVDDIYETVANGADPVHAGAAAEACGKEIAALLYERVTSDSKPPSLKERVLRMSAAGKCLRKLWYQYRPEFAPIKLDPATLIKFKFGDMIEQLTLFLARCAGHKVTNAQKRVRIDLPNGWTVVGHIDAFIDGELVDVKSAASFSMRKFKTGDFGDDAFGYVDQLALYRDACEAETASWVAVDKQHGHMVRCKLDADPIRIDDLVSITNSISNGEVPERLPHGSKVLPNGNVELTPVCSYCEYRKHCYPDLRSFAYSGKIVRLAHVAKEPKVPEITDE